MKTLDLVRSENTNSPLDRTRGRVLGRSTNGMTVLWIVELTASYTDERGEVRLAH